MSWYETSVFGAPLEVLHKKRGSGPQLHFFLKLELVELYMFGWQFCRVGGVEQFFIVWSAPKRALKVTCRHAYGPFTC
jgi:hypothetical protein